MPAIIAKVGVQIVAQLASGIILVGVEKITTKIKSKYDEKYGPEKE